MPPRHEMKWMMDIYQHAQKLTFPATNTLIFKNEIFVKNIWEKYVWLKIFLKKNQYWYTPAAVRTGAAVRRGAAALGSLRKYRKQKYCFVTI